MVFAQSYFVPIARIPLTDGDAIVAVIPIDIADAIGRIYSGIGGSPAETRRGYFDVFHAFYNIDGKYGFDSPFTIEGNLYFDVKDVTGATKDGLSNPLMDIIKRRFKVHKQGDNFLTIMPLEVADALRDVLYNLAIFDSNARDVFDALKEMAFRLDTLLPMDSRKHQLSPSYNEMITLKKRGH